MNKNLKLERALKALQSLEGKAKLSQEEEKELEEALAPYELTLKDCEKLLPQNILKFFRKNSFQKVENLTFLSHEAWENLQEKPDIFYSSLSTMFGKIFLAFTEKEISYLSFEKDEELNKKELFSIFQGANFFENKERAEKIAKEIFEENKKFPLLYKGNPLQKEVYSALLAISTLSSYSEIAQQSSCPKAVRAVASYVGKNYITYLIPCHKVLSKSGKIGGFAYDISLKKLLILHDLKKEKL